jgi:hypothetical protein
VSASWQNLVGGWHFERGGIDLSRSHGESIRHGILMGMLPRREGSAQQMGEVNGKALRCGSNESQARRGRSVAWHRGVMSYCARHGPNVHIVGIGVGTRAVIIASFPWCASKKATCRCHPYTLRASAVTVKLSKPPPQRAPTTPQRTPYYLHIATAEPPPNRTHCLSLSATLI